MVSRLSDPLHTATDVFNGFYRNINVPALPAGAVVTSATFSLVALSGSLVAPGEIKGTSQVPLGYISAESLEPPGPCTFPGCAPTLATTVTIAYQLGLGPNCLTPSSFTCFTAPATGSFDLLSLGFSPTYFADGFSIGDSVDLLIGRGLDGYTVAYSGFNSETDYAFSGVGPELAESVVLNYTTVPEPATLLLLIPGLLALVGFRLKKATA